MSKVERVEKAVVVVSLPPKLTPESRELAEMIRVVVAAQSLRRTGSAALNLCYLAAGRFDAYWGGNTKAWDVAAGALMIREAGGIITDYRGKPRISTCHNLLRRRLRRCIKKYCDWWEINGK